MDRKLRAPGPATPGPTHGVHPGSTRVPDTGEPQGVPLKLHIDQEMIDVWLDETGIHFSHPDGTETRGHLPWSIAIAMSLVPSELPRMASASAL